MTIDASSVELRFSILASVHPMRKEADRDASKAFASVFFIIVLLNR
jgi:hypothetical protein